MLVNIVKKSQDLIKQQNYSAALDQVLKGLEIESANKNLLLMLAGCYQNLQYFPEALKAVEQGKAQLKLPGDDDKLLF